MNTEIQMYILFAKYYYSFDFFLQSLKNIKTILGLCTVETQVMG